MLRSIFLLAFAAAPLAVAHPAPAKREVAEKSADARDRIICKRFVETGSLVKGYRTCKTKWDWERERENLRTLSPTESCRQDDGSGVC